MVDEDDLLAIRREIERIHDRIDDIRHIQAQQVKADGRVLDVILDLFSGKGGPTLARVYLAVDGKRSVTEIAEAAGVGKATASRSCTLLHEHGLLEFHDVKGTKVYSKSIMEKALHLSKFLRKVAHGT